MTALIASGCGFFLDDLGSSDTDNTPHNGVYVGCQNLPAGGGADETGGDGGGGIGVNFWWTQYDGPPLASWQICGPGVTDEVCCVAGFTPICYQKEYALPGSEIYDGGIGPICVTPSYEGGIDPLNDWVDGGYPTIDAALRADCTAQCENKLNPDGTPQNCEDADWVEAKTYNNWDPSQGFNCPGAEELNEDDPDGGAIDWSVVGGLATPLPLSCDLTSDCVDWFYPHVGEYIVTPGEAAIIEPETRSAHYLSVEGGGSQLKIDMSGSGAGVDDTEALFGMAEYSALDCGEAVCPFFLANLSAFNTTDAWEISLDAATSSYAKKVSNVQIDLMQSTLGVHNMALDTIAFAPGALRLRVEITVDSCAGCSTFGNGTHVAIVENENYVFADYDNGALSVSHSFAMQSGTATLDISVNPVEYPPSAVHDLAATEVCDDPGGLMLDASHSLSSDPDNDLVSEMWWVDGIPCGHGCVVPRGNHEISLEAHDARGAVDRGVDQWVFVDAGPKCAP